MVDMGDMAGDMVATTCGGEGDESGGDHEDTLTSVADYDRENYRCVCV